MKVERYTPRFSWLTILVLACAPFTAQAQDTATLPRDARTLAETFGVEVVVEGEPFPVKTYHGDISGTDATEEEGVAYLRILLDELGLYPKSFMNRTRLRRIVVCKDLAFAGQLRASIPDFEHDAIYFDAVAGNYDEAYQRRIIHHELFHVVDWQDDFILYDDTAWKALNPPEFAYGTGGKDMQDDAYASLPTDRYPGFLTRYATSGVEEDKAETFSFLISDIGLIDRRSKEDEVIARKVAAMRSLLLSFCSDMNDTFWKRVRKRAAKKPDAREF